tara:strand:- start:19602 stop:20072 length:471 start_codon:yes stop_codon:yes gene_type:complete
MATNNLLQRLPMKDDVTFTDVAESNRRQVETFISNNAIAAGNWVQFDNSKTGPNQVIYVGDAGTAANGNGLVVGVALHATTAADQRLEVCVGGYCASAAVATGVTAETVIAMRTGTAGLAIAAANTDLANACGVVLTTIPVAPGNLGEVFVYKNKF